MNYLIGNKEIFAVEIEISQQKWDNQTSIWLNNIKVGDWEDKNILAPFINSLYRIARKYDDLELDKFNDLECEQIYLAIHPHFENPDEFFDLTLEDQKAFAIFDKYIFSWGEDFDSWGLSVIYKEGFCKFLWLQTSLNNETNLNVRNKFQCYEVELKLIQEVYNELTKIIPDSEWPVLIPK